jgi:nucleoside 2-deoxyribosyltransferase
MKIYFAGPLFSLTERQFNQALTEELEQMGFSVFLPQRDGAEADKPPYDTMTREGRRRALFELDTQEIKASDIFLFILDGRIPDEGACVELGMAYQHRELTGKPKVIIGFHSDCRAAFLGARLNPMLRVCFDHIVENKAQLFQCLSQKGYEKRKQTDNK